MTSSPTLRTVSPIPTRILVYGSCVGRDTFAYLPSDRFHLAGYIPRQSIVGAYAPPTSYAFDLSSLTSPFQRRVTEASWRGTIQQAIQREAEQFDMVLWDLTDERAGLYLMPDGSYITRTVELDASGLSSQIELAAVRHIPFGTDEHFSLFTQAATTWWHDLSRAGLSLRVLVLAPDWAAHVDTGADTPPSYGFSASDANYLLERYYGFIEGALQIPVVRVGRTIADSAHQWGLAPFHFSPPVYEALTAVVTEFVDEMVVPRSSSSTLVDEQASTVRLLSSRPSGPNLVALRRTDQSLEMTLGLIPETWQTAGSIIDVTIPQGEHPQGTIDSILRKLHRAAPGRQQECVYLGCRDTAEVVLAMAQTANGIAALLVQPELSERTIDNPPPTHAFVAWGGTDAQPRAVALKRLEAIRNVAEKGSMHLLRTEADIQLAVRKLLTSLLGPPASVPVGSAP